MLLGDFFEVNQLKEGDNGSIEASVLINKEHNIFKGHFPDFPIVPGVCMIQMIKEIIGMIYEGSMTFVQGDNIKFLRFIDPNQSNRVEVTIKNQHIDGDALKSEAQIFSGDTIFLKLKGIFQKNQ